MLLKLLEAGLAALQAADYGLFGAEAALLRRLAFDHHLERRADDVYIATYPKSGTTLMQMMVHQLRGPGDMEDLPHINAAVPWLELEILAEAWEHLAALPSPRVFKTHFLHAHLPPGVKVIYVVRDVREVFLSAYHHQARMLGRRADMATFAREFHRRGLYHGTWSEHLASWWPHRCDPNVLSLTYDGILADLPGTVRRVAAHCGFALDEREMPRILERCGIAFMRRHDEKLDPRRHQAEAQGFPFFRRGRPGLEPGELREEDDRRLARRARALARRLGASGAEDPFAFLAAGPPLKPGPPEAGPP